MVLLRSTPLIGLASTFGDDGPPVELSLANAPPGSLVVSWMTFDASPVEMFGQLDIEHGIVAKHIYLPRHH